MIKDILTDIAAIQQRIIKIEKMVIAQQVAELLEEVQTIEDWAQKQINKVRKAEAALNKELRYLLDAVQMQVSALQQSEESVGMRQFKAQSIHYTVESIEMQILDNAQFVETRLNKIQSKVSKKLIPIKQHIQCLQQHMDKI